jgi:hypothetical protein
MNEKERLERIAQARAKKQAGKHKRYGLSFTGSGLPKEDNHEAPDMPYTVTGVSMHKSPEAVLWTQESKIDTPLVRLLGQVKTLSDSERRDSYNFLRALPNKPPLYFRDSVFAIAWELHYANLGKRGIVRELASTMWMIGHLKRHGYSAQYAIERLQGVLKTNKIDSMFHSETIDAMINNYEREAAHKENYHIAESDYSQSIGESVNPASYASEQDHIALEKAKRDSVDNYLDGLSVLIKSRIERYVGMGMYSFISNDTVKSPILGMDNFTSRLFRGYLKHEGLSAKIAEGSMSKRMFLTYVYTYYRPLDAYGIAAHYTDSINMSNGKLGRNLVKVEKIRRVSDVREASFIQDGKVVMTKSGRVNRPLLARGKA